MSIFQKIRNRITKTQAEPAPTSAACHAFPLAVADADCTPEFIAKGGFGTVYKVRKNGKTAALKVISCSTAQELEHAKKECDIMASAADNAHTVTLLRSHIDRTDTGATVYLLQEYLTTFKTYYDINDLYRIDVIRMGIELCHAIMHYRDKGFYHGDIHLRNLYVTTDGHFKLGDFGSAHYITEQTEYTPIQGNRAYMAPEAYRTHKLSEVSEIYSLGFMLYILLNHGYYPFLDHCDLEEANEKRLSCSPLPPPDLDNKALSQAIAIACDPYEQNRFQSTEDFLLALTTAFSEERGRQCLIPRTPPTSDTFQTAALTCELPSTEPLTAALFSFSTDCISVLSPSAPEFPAFTMPAPQAHPSSFIIDTGASSIDFTSGPPVQIFDADEFAYTCALMPPAQEHGACPPPAPQSAPVPNMTQVQFSAIAPKSAVKGEYALVQLYMFEEAFRSVVDEAMADAEVEMTRKNSGILKVGDNTAVKVVLSSPDLEIDDNENEQIWYGDYLVFDFAFEVPSDFKKKQILLKAAVYFNNIPATKLMLTMKTQSDPSAALELQRNDVRRAYMSYAREDQSRVGGLVQGMRRVRPDLDIFFDVFTLRCGDNWEQILYQNLESADMLFLCWSRSAKKSEWVEREWRYMLTNKGADSIEPLPIEPPEICPPPAELSMKYFNDNLLYMIDRKTDW